MASGWTVLAWKSYSFSIFIGHLELKPGSASGQLDANKVVKLIKNFEMFLRRLLVIERNWAAKHLTLFFTTKVGHFKTKNAHQADN